MNYLILLLLSASAMAYPPPDCHYGSEAIQAFYDKYELFSKTRAFDPADSKVPLEKYQFYVNDGESSLTVTINGVSMQEYYRTDGDNNIQTKSGHYRVKGGVSLNYMRGENGEFSFEDQSNQKKFSSSLQSIDAELPSDFEEDYKQVLVDLNAMRKKMFNYRNGLSKEDFERVHLFESTPSPNGDGFSARYIEQDETGITVSKQSGSDTISGLLSCGYKEQKYNIVDGKVVTEGVPGFIRD